MSGDTEDAEAPRRLVQREWQAQRADNAFLAKALPPGAYYTAIDVGRSRNANDGQMRKLRGVKAGIPDWLIVWNGVTLWIERKVKQSLSESQKLTRDALLANGHQWALARSTEDVEAACLAAGIPLRATLGGIRERIAAQNERLPPKKRAAPKMRKKAADPAALKVAARWRKGGLFR